MRIEQQNTLSRQCLRITSEDDFEVRDFREKMLLHNKVKGLLSFDVLRQNDERTYEYSVSGLMRLSDRCDSTHISSDDLKRLLGRIIETLHLSREYLLLEEDFVLTPDTIYINTECESHVAYYPGYGRGIRDQMCALAEYLLDKIEYTDEAAVLLAYSFYMKTRDDSCRIDDLAELLENSERSNTEKKNVTEKTKSADKGGSDDKQNVADRAEITSKSEEQSKEDRTEQRTHERHSEIVKKMIPKAEVGIILAVIVVEAILFFKGTVSFKSGVIKAALTLGAGVFVAAETIRLAKELRIRLATDTSSSTEYLEDEGTILLDDVRGREGMTLVSVDYPPVVVNHFPFVIGKDKDMSDYVLNVKGVSRGHIRLDRTEGTTFVTDLNSTNGTYINGIRLKAGEPAIFTTGDRLDIANCVFYYNCGASLQRAQ